MSFDLDEIDRRIIYRISENARETTAPDVADEVDVTDTTVRNRIARLEENGVITGYHAAVDYERADGLLTNLYLCTTDAQNRDRHAKELLMVPGVVNVREIMTGHGNLRVKAVGEDTEDLTRIAREITNRGIEIVDEDLIRSEYNAPYQPYGPDEKPTAPSLTDFLQLRGGAEVVELTVADDAQITGLTLSEANERNLLDSDDLVLTIERDKNTLAARGSTTVHSGDMVRVFSQGGVSLETIETFSGLDEAEIRESTF